MELKPYKKYKPSGIEWIGEIPDHWELRKVARSFNIIGSGTTPEAGNLKFYSEQGFNWINTGDLNDGVLEGSSKKVTQEALSEFSTLRLYKPDTLLIAMYGATIGKLGILKISACTNQACCALAESVYFKIKYAFYWFIASKQNIIAMSFGGGQPNISQEIIRSLKLPAPPLNEQEAIVTFLEEKTSLIDKLITDKQKLIELLKEEKAALINQAVTKGINPKAKMKESGIEWLGKIPEHWGIKKLKYIGSIKYGLGQPPKEKVNGLPLIRATNIGSGKIYTENLIFVDPDDIPFERDPVLIENDIIVVRSGAYTADSAIIPKKYEGAITGYDMVFRTNRNTNPHFISNTLLSDYVLNSQLIPQSLRAAQPHLNREELGETLIAIPEKSEQEQIVDYINSNVSKIETAFAKIENEIGLLQEYRTALISEVVTGKVDVQ